MILLPDDFDQTQIPVIFFHSALFGSMLINHHIFTSISINNHHTIIIILAWIQIEYSLNSFDLLLILYPSLDLLNNLEPNSTKNNKTANEPISISTSISIFDQYKEKVSLIIIFDGPYEIYIHSDLVNDL